MQKFNWKIRRTASGSSRTVEFENIGEMMTYVVTEKCIGCKHTDCIEVCPVDCFHEGENFLVIDPNGCVDCGLCEIECPVDAIVSESELPQEKLHYLALNLELANVWPCITEKKEALPNAAEWATRTDKLIHLVR